MYIDLGFIVEMIGWFIFISASLGVGIGLGSILTVKLTTTKKMAEKMANWSIYMSKRVTEELLDEN